MTVSTPHPSLDAFKRAVADDYAGRSRYPNGAVVLPAEIERTAFVAAVKDHDPRTTTVVFVREDGVEMVVSSRAPRRLREQILARVGVVFLDIEIRSSGATLYHDHRYARNSRDIFKLEQRKFSCA